MKKEKLNVPALAFVCLCLAILMTPFVCMPFASEEGSSENRTLASAPELFDEDGSFNVNVLSDAGAYFEDHFSFRSQLITANAQLRAGLESSPSTQVVVGTEGWLYYAGTLPDYLGQSALSDRALWNVAHNLKLMQTFTESQGARFVFTVAPNKNSLYDENMPYYYLESDEPSNWARLVPQLQKNGVNYVDMFKLFKAQNEVLYYKEDTHWNNKGALLATNALLEKLSYEPLSYGAESWKERLDNQGDIAAMLFPSSDLAEASYYVKGVNDSVGLSGAQWRYVSGSAVTDNTVTTQGPGLRNVVVYRDSFGNALLPYIAASSATATFSKLIPYNGLLASEINADAVIVERAERNIAYLAQTAPLAMSPVVDWEGVPESKGQNWDTTLRMSNNGPFLILQGVLDKRLENPNASVFVVVEDAQGNTTAYDAYAVSEGLESAYQDTEGGAASSAQVSDYGFVANLPARDINLALCTIHVVTAADNHAYAVKSFGGAKLLVQSAS